MEAGRAKGTVTPLSSLFPAQDAHKAATRVQDAISEKQRELEHLLGFISDNANLINLVQKLPEELHHEVMVPFGKAAFFPGRLIHTNEFLVLLGEGYYAERTSKQTVEILKRRGKSLDSQVDSLKAMMDNLKAEASFFDATASEAEEGLVEIREEYVEGNFSEQESGSGVNKQDVPSVSGVDGAKIVEEDAEYARIMSRLDELEKEEELAAANGDQSDEEDEEEKETADQSLEKFYDDKQSYSKGSTSTWLRDENVGSKELLDKYQQQEEASTNPSNCSGLSVQSSSKEDVSSGKNSLGQTQRVRNPNPAAKSVTFAEVKEKNQRLPPSTSEAFTGSIIERPPAIPKNSKQETETPLQPSGSQPSKPVSRFKMQRR